MLIGSLTLVGFLIDLIVLGVPILIIYFVIKKAVKKGYIEAQKELNDKDKN